MFLITKSSYEKNTESTIALVLSLVSVQIQESIHMVAMSQVCEMHMLRAQVLEK